MAPRRPVAGVERRGWMLDTAARKHLFTRVVQWEESRRPAPPSWWWGVAVAVVTSAVFAATRHGALLAWDDDINITGNPHLRALTWENLRWMFSDCEYMRRYVPLTWLGWALEHACFGLTARSSHVGNVFLHAANAALLFLLVRRTLALWRPDQPPGASTNLLAAAGSLFWAVHPLRVEVVAWASGRIYLQAVFFLLLTTIAYLNAADAPPGSARRRGWFAIAVGAYTSSLLTYPLGFTYVAVLLVIDVWLLGRCTTGGWRDGRNRGVLLDKIPFLAVAAIIVALTLVARFHAQGLWQPPPSLAEFGIGSRMMQAFYIWAYYVWRPLAPVELAPVYTTLVWFRPTDLAFVVSAVAVVALSAALFRWRRRFPGACALWLIHLVLLVPTLGLTEHPHYPNDRYSYLVGMVWAPAAAGALGWLHRRARSRTIAVGTAAILAGLAALTVMQFRIWRSSEELFRYLYLQVGDSPYRADIALRLAEVLRGEGRITESIDYYRETLRIDRVGRRAGVAHFGLGIIARAGARNDEALEHYTASIQLQPDFAPAYVGLGEVLAAVGRYDAAIANFQKALSLDPDDAIARAALARLQAR